MLNHKVLPYKAKLSDVCASNCGQTGQHWILMYVEVSAPNTEVVPYTHTHTHSYKCV